MLGKVNSDKVIIADAILYFTEGNIPKALEKSKGLITSKIDLFFNAGKLAFQGKWSEASKILLTELSNVLNIDLPVNQSKRLLKKAGDNIQDIAQRVLVEALVKSASVSYKTAEAVVGLPGYSNDDVAHGVFNVIGNYNIPYASKIAKVVNLVYHIVEGGHAIDARKDYVEGVKQILTGVLSAVKVTNSRDWINAVFSLGEGIKTKKDEHYLSAVGSVLEAIDVKYGKEWVFGVADLYNAVAKKDNSKYAGAISNFIIAGAEINQVSKQNLVRNGVSLVWNVTQDPKQAVIQYVKDTIATKLTEEFKLDINRTKSGVETIANLVEAVTGKEEKYPEAISNLLITTANITNNQDKTKISQGINLIWQAKTEPQAALRQYVDNIAKDYLKNQFKLVDRQVIAITNTSGKFSNVPNASLFTDVVNTVAQVNDQNKLNSWVNDVWQVASDRTKSSQFIQQYLNTTAKNNLVSQLRLGTAQAGTIIDISTKLVPVIKGDKNQYTPFLTDLVNKGITLQDTKLKTVLTDWVKDLSTGLTNPATLSKTFPKLLLNAILPSQVTAKYGTIISDLNEAINGNKSKYGSIISQSLITLGNIQDKQKQTNLSSFVDSTWQVVTSSNLKTGVTKYLEVTAKKYLKEQVKLDEEEVNTLVDIFKEVQNGKYTKAITKGFELAGFGGKSDDIAKALDSFKDGKYIEAVIALTDVVGSKQAAKFLEVGKAITELKFYPNDLKKNLDFDESKENLVLKLLQTLDTKNPTKEVEQANKTADESQPKK